MSIFGHYTQLYYSEMINKIEKDLNPLSDDTEILDITKKNITALPDLTKFKYLIKLDFGNNQLVILDNASSHRNAKIKELVNKHNNLLYSVPYQHFTNSIENFFSMLKSRLQKLEGIKYEELKINIEKVVKEIPKEKYKNIIRGTYKRPIGFVRKPSNRTRKLKNYK